MDLTGPGLRRSMVHEVSMPCNMGLRADLDPENFARYDPAAARPFT
jgi:hypothetical protein